MKVSAFIQLISSLTRLALTELTVSTEALHLDTQTCRSSQETVQEEEEEEEEEGTPRSCRALPYFSPPLLDQVSQNPLGPQTEQNI